MSFFFIRVIDFSFSFPTSRRKKKNKCPSIYLIEILFSLIERERKFGEIDSFAEKKHAYTQND